jgi:hypothetical protein
MARIIRRLTLTLMLASLPCVVTAAGSLAEENGADQALPYDCGNGYYAPGSYSSWFYVSPPSCEQTSVASEAATPAPDPTALNLPAYYDFDLRWGPLFA